MVIPGDELYGCCDCFFHGKDGHWYFGGVIEAVGDDWVVIRTCQGEALFASFEGGWKEQMPALLEKWADPIKAFE